MYFLGYNLEDMKHKKPFDKSVYRSLVLVSQFGISMLVPICMMTLLGWYLDKQLGTSYITIILFFVGAIAGGQSIYRLAQRSCREDEEQSPRLHDSNRQDEHPVDRPKKSSGWKQEEK